MPGDYYITDYTQKHNKAKRRAVRYHKNHPQGQTFNMDEVSMDVLAAEGWVRNPAFLGLNPWGASSQAAVDRLHQAFEAGHITEGAGVSRDFEQQFKEDIDKAKAEALRLEKENEALRRQLSPEQSLQELQEHESDTFAEDARGSKVVEVKKDGEVINTETGGHVAGPVKTLTTI